MAKFEDVFEDTQALFTSLILNADLARFVSIKILANNEQKEIFKVVKANDLVRHLTEEDVIIILNEKIFEKLPEEQKKMIGDEALASISFDSERNKLNISTPDLVTYSGIITKYSLEKYMETRELIRLLYSQEKDKDADNKPAEKEKAE